MNIERVRNRSRRRLAPIVTLSGIGLLGGLASPGEAFAVHTAGRPADVVRQRLDAPVSDDGYPAAPASVTTRKHRAAAHPEDGRRDDP
jgi:hypothetical protein